MSEIEDEKEYIVLIHTTLSTINMVFTGRGIKEILLQIFAEKDKGGLTIIRLQDELYTHFIRTNTINAIQYGEFDKVNNQHKKDINDSRDSVLSGFKPRKFDG